MLWNIVDHRTNKHNVEIDVVFESSSNDNSISGASIAELPKSVIFDWEYKTTLSNAIHIANSRWDSPVTIYIYDFGTKPASPSAV